MKSLIAIIKRFSLGALLAGIPLLGGCADNTMTWREEVKLLDGRTIIVTQKRRCESAYTGQNFAKCISRETWLTIRLPEFGSKDIVWNEKLDPMVVNLYQDKLYVVGVFPTGLEFDLYGKPKPPYVGYRWEGTAWQRLPFSEIPEAIYDGNMIIDLPPDGMTLLTNERKNSREMNGHRGHPKSSRRIDPAFIGNY